MNDPAPELLARRHVALAARTWPHVHLAAPVAYILRADSAFRSIRADGTEGVSLNRVSAAEKQTLEPGRLRIGVCRPLRRDPLSDSSGAALGDERTGTGRHLLA
jgi:hypothetical protein